MPEHAMEVLEALLIGYDSFLLSVHWQGPAARLLYKH